MLSDVSRYRGVAVHGLVVLGLVALSAPLLFPSFDPAIGWNGWIAVSYGYLLLVVLGAPWSLLWFGLNALGTSDAVSQALFLPLVLGGALLNMVAHYGWRQRQGRAAVPVDQALASSPPDRLSL